MKKESYPSPVDGTLDAPASKSYAQRALAAALLTDGVSTLQQMGLCNDTSAALEVVQRLGAVVECDHRTYTVRGGIRPVSSELNIGESGLSTRLFTPIASLCSSPVTITGHGSILTRPITMMENPLRALGVKFTSRNGFLPVEVCGPIRGGDVSVDGSLSSQFLTGLLMALPKAQNDSVIYVGKLNSKPYIDMTIEVMQAFGVEISHRDYEEFFIAGNQTYRPTTYSVEGDWSGASCLLVAGAVAGNIKINHLNPCSLQADLAIIDALERAGARISSEGDSYTLSKGALKGFEFDATHCPDLFPALVALAANCKGKTLLTGTTRLTNKESNRAQTLADVFGKLGVEVDLSETDIMVVKGGKIRGGEVHSYNDHRIAMAAAVAGLTAKSKVVIDGAEAVDKSYPGFWEDLRSITV